MDMSNVIYIMEIKSLGIRNLKEPDSRNSRKRHSRTTLRGEPMGGPNFCS